MTEKELIDKIDEMDRLRKHLVYFKAKQEDIENMDLWISENEMARMHIHFSLGKENALHWSSEIALDINHAPAIVREIYKLIKLSIAEYLKDCERRLEEYK